MTDFKKRKIYAYELEMAFVKNQKIISGINTNIIEEALQYIIGLPPKNKEESKQDEWFFYLDSVSLTDAKKLVYGWFKGARIGTKIPLIEKGTFKERENPKSLLEGERTKTHFVLRKQDGLFLLESSGHTVTPRRIENYIETRYRDKFDERCVHHITLKNLLDPRFIERISELHSIKTATIKVSVQPDRYGQNEAIAVMQRDAAPTMANYYILKIGLDKRRQGMNKDALVAWIREKMSDSQHILSARVEGKIGDEDAHIDLKGIEEKYTFSVPTNIQGEVLSKKVLSHMIELGRSRKRIK